MPESHITPSYVKKLGPRWKKRLCRGGSAKMGVRWDSVSAWGGEAAVFATFSVAKSPPPSARTLAN